MTVDAVISSLLVRLAEPLPPTTQPRPLLDQEAGLALLYARAGRVDPAYRPVAHRFLGAANAILEEKTQHNLYDGIPALAFAANMAAWREGEYANLLSGLDASVFRVVKVMLAREHDRLRAGGIAASYHDFDVISGLTGLGRYLLSRPGPQSHALLAEILAYFALLVRPIVRDGVELPGWWAESGLQAAGGQAAGGHVNLGMAHGICGPLALLATAWRAGVQVPGQAAAIETIVEFLVDWSEVDETGRYWPGALLLDDLDDLGDSATRPARLRRGGEAWCYGRPGVARAIQLAALALEKLAWLDIVREAAAGLADLPEREWRVRDTCLCHGWAGLLQIYGRIHADDPRTETKNLLEVLADRTVAAFDPAVPYGFRQHSGPRGELVDEPGFLIGAAGIALALLDFRHGMPPASHWDAALALS